MVCLEVVFSSSVSFLLFLRSPSFSDPPIRENSLLYFENSTDSLNETLAKGVISLDEAYIQTIEDHKFSFCFAVGTAGRVYFFLAKDRADLDKWTHAILAQTSGLSSESQPSKQPKYQNAVLDKVTFIFFFLFLLPLHFLMIYYYYYLSRK